MSDYHLVLPRDGLHTRVVDDWGVTIANGPCPRCTFPTARVLGGAAHTMRCRCESCGKQFGRPSPGSSGDLHAALPRTRI